MAGYFFDTSAVSKHYHAEAGTADVDAIFLIPNVRIYVSRLATVEYRSALARKVRNRQLTEPVYQHLCKLFEADTARKIIRVSRVIESHFRQAELLIEKYALTESLRTLDAIQLSVALENHRQGFVDHFVCADKVLCAVAKAEGLSVINPAP